MKCPLCNKWGGFWFLGSENSTKLINIRKPDRFEINLKIKKPNRIWMICKFCNTAKNFQKKKKFD